PLREAAHQEPQRAWLVGGPHVLERQNPDGGEVEKACRLGGPSGGGEAADLLAKVVEARDRVEGRFRTLTECRLLPNVEPAGNDLELPAQPHQVRGAGI